MPELAKKPSDEGDDEAAPDVNWNCLYRVQLDVVPADCRSRYRMSVWYPDRGGWACADTLEGDDHTSLHRRGMKEGPEWCRLHREQAAAEGADRQLPPPLSTPVRPESAKPAPAAAKKPTILKMTPQPAAPRPRLPIQHPRTRASAVGGSDNWAISVKKKREFDAKLAQGNDLVLILTEQGGRVRYEVHYAPDMLDKRSSPEEFWLLPAGDLHAAGDRRVTRCS